MSEEASFLKVSSYCIVKNEDDIVVAELLIVGMFMGCIKLEVVPYDDKLSSRYFNST